jgi:hypothetical protein
MNIWDVDDSQEKYLAKKFVDKIEQKGSKKTPNTYGLCAKCTNFTYIKTQYGKELAFCTNSNKMKPSPVDPIVVCSDFYPMGQLSIEVLWNMATMIEVKKQNIGFTVDDKNETKK